MSNIKIDLSLIDENILALDQKLIHKLLIAIKEKRDEYLERIRVLEDGISHLRKPVTLVSAK